MAPITVETQIDRSADDVFAYLRDHENQIEWQKPNVLELAVEPPGPSRVGTLVHKVRKTPMGKISFTEEVVDFDEEQRTWTEVTVSGGIKGTEITWQVVGSDSAATVRLTAEMRGTGLNRLLLPLIKKSATQGWKDEQAQLKDLLEAHT